MDGDHAAEFLCLPTVSLAMTALFLAQWVARDPGAEHVVLWDWAAARLPRGEKLEPRHLDSYKATTRRRYFSAWAAAVAKFTTGPGKRPRKSIPAVQAQSEIRIGSEISMADKSGVSFAQ